MKKLIGLALVLALGFQCLSKLGLITFYHFYQEYVIEEYCENKDQPLLECAGSCFLKKGLEKNNEGDQKSAETLKQIEIPAFILSSYIKEPIIFAWYPHIFPEANSSYLFLYTSTPFQPPKGI